MRKLATVRRIDSIRPIEGADAIECAVVGGWTVVTKKGDFRAGDLAVYCEIDSWIPHELAPFLSKGQEPREYNGVKGERLRTVKLRGQLSQGLLIAAMGTFPEGTDMTEALGIQKYEPLIPTQLAGEVKGPFPIFIPKTDQERIQNLANELEQWKADSLTWEVTEKLDGSSMTVYYHNGEVGVCSRNLELRDTPDNTMWKVAHRDGIVTLLYDEDRSIAIQGELVGEGIQGNPYRIRGQSFYVFDVYLIDQGRYMLPQERAEFCEFHQLLHVPILTNKITNSDTTVADLLVAADGKSEMNFDAEREGLVFKCIDKNISFKAISNKLLLKNG